MPVEWVTDRIIVIDYCQSKSQSVRQNNASSSAAGDFAPAHDGTHLINSQSEVYFLRHTQQG